MNNSVNSKGILGCIIMLFFFSLNGQEVKYSNNQSKSTIDQATDKRTKSYKKLLKLGYKESEIFEDLGNANFLVENYEEAIFWYDQLIDINAETTTAISFNERYLFALKKIRSTKLANISEEKDWLTQIRMDYQTEEGTRTPEKLSKYKKLDFQQSQEQLVSQELTLEDLGLKNEVVSNSNDEGNSKFSYNAPIAVTEDGHTAYYSKPVYTKPLYGIFSKKEVVHKIYKADKINGKWHNIREVTLAPKHFSTIHPAISSDGKRLFFASDMPGTFGKYDIYVADVKSDGSFGKVKNLGQKVNTGDNDLYPSIKGESSLFFASDGHKGMGGLDIYMVQVDNTRVGSSVNLGSNINSMEDDFSILITGQNGMGYVMSNRGENKSNPQRVAFTYSKDKREKLLQKRQFNILEAINDNSQIDYSTSVFED